MAAETIPTTPPTAATPAARRRLGRGLGSLISSAIKVDISPPQVQRPAAVTSIAPPHSAPAATPKAAPASHSGTDSDELADGIRMLALDEIQPNPRQPRQHFDEEALRALAKSIKTSGLMQPIVVRPARAGGAPGSGGYQLIAGERRWRAAQIAGLSRIPAVVRTIDDRVAAELSLVENLQREDLNPMERAEAFRRLIDEFGLTHSDVAERVGLDRTSVTNHLRLNELDEFTKDAVRAARLSLGHAKALLAITNIEARGGMAARAVREEWSVRELERQVKQTQPARDGAPGPHDAKSKGVGTTPHMADLQKRLAAHLGTKVQLRAGRTKGSGTLIIEFYTLDQFEGLMRRMQFETD